MKNWLRLFRFIILFFLVLMENFIVINCIWLCSDRGYKVKYFLKYWEVFRKVCYYDSFGVVLKVSLNLVGYFIDFVGFFLVVVI